MKWRSPKELLKVNSPKLDVSRRSFITGSAALAAYQWLRPREADARFIANQLNGFGARKVDTSGPLTITYLGTTSSGYALTCTGNINFGTASAGAIYVALFGGWRNAAFHSYTEVSIDSGTYDAAAISGATTTAGENGNFRSSAWQYEDTAGAISGTLGTLIRANQGGAAMGAVWYKVENVASGAPHDVVKSAPGTNNVNHNISVVDGGGVIGFRIDNNANGDTWSWSGNMTNADEDVEHTGTETDHASASKTGLGLDASFDLDATTVADADHQGVSLSYSPAA